MKKQPRTQSFFFLRLLAIIICCTPLLSMFSQADIDNSMYVSSGELHTDYPVVSFLSDEVMLKRLQCRNSVYDLQGKDLCAVSELYGRSSSASIVFSDSSLLNERDGDYEMDCSDVWPMYCFNNKHIGCSPFSTVSNNGAVIWRFGLDQPVESGVSIGPDGTIYFGGFDRCLYAMNPDGTVKWSYQTSGMILSSTPVIKDGVVYVGNWGDKVTAVNAVDGTLVWETFVNGSVDTSPAISPDGTIYVGTIGGWGHVGDVVALSSNGSIKWVYRTDDFITSSPTVDDDGTIYVGSADSYVYALNPDGTLRWRFKTGDIIKGSASVYQDVVYIGSYDDFLYALYWDGSLKWKCQLSSGTQSNPSIGPDGTIYMGGVDITAVNPDGSVKWVFDLGNNYYIHRSSPAVSADGTIYIGACKGNGDGGDIVAISADGTLRWRWPLGSEAVQSSPCIDSDGRVYIGVNCDPSSTEPEGFLYAFGPGSMSPPFPPSIDGPSTVKSDERYIYTFNTTDPEGHDIYYYVDWGDGYAPGWWGPYESGHPVKPDYSYPDRGTYVIRAKAKDEYGLESEWSTFELSVPKNKDAMFDSLLARLFHVYPWLFSLIEHLL